MVPVLDFDVSRNENSTSSNVKAFLLDEKPRKYRARSYSEYGVLRI